jgi:hypothetical protein
MAEAGQFGNKWHEEVIAFRTHREETLQISFAKYVLTRLLAQLPEIVEIMYHAIMAFSDRDTRHRTSLLGKGDCLLFGEITSGARSTICATFSFHDALFPFIWFRDEHGKPMRFAFTVQHVVWIFEHRESFPISLNLTMVHFCHLRNCCNSHHLYWNTDADNRSRDQCRIRGYSFLQLRKRRGRRTIICFCQHRPKCLIFKKERHLPTPSFHSLDEMQQFVVLHD